MSVKELLDQLRQTRFLHDIGDENLDKIAAVAQLVEFPAGRWCSARANP